jgi:hypothetical protein
MFPLQIDTFYMATSFFHAGVTTFLFSPYQVPEAA